MIIFILISMSFFEVKRSWNTLSTYLLNGWWDDCWIFSRAATNKSHGKEQSRSQNVQNINIQKFQNVKLLRHLEWVVLCWLLSISSALFQATPSFIWFANSITCFYSSHVTHLTSSVFLLHFTLLSPQSLLITEG